MTVEEERARLLRAIARGGFSPYSDDQDGSTANTLYEMAEELAPIAPPPPPKRAPWYRRQWLRWKLRRKMRMLGMLPVLMLLVPNLVTRAQAPGDSLIGTSLSRAVIPSQWEGDTHTSVFCLIWTSEIPERPHVLVVIDAAPADTSLSPYCPRPKGGFYPLWIDGPRCPPGNVSPFTEREWIVVRCGQNDIARYRRPSEKQADEGQR